MRLDKKKGLPQNQLERNQQKGGKLKFKKTLKEQPPA